MQAYTGCADLEERMRYEAKGKETADKFLFYGSGIDIIFYPFLRGVKISLTDWDGFSPSYNFVGLQNFTRILKDPSIKGPIINSLFFTIVTVIVDNVVGLGVAFAFRKDKRSNRIFRTCVFMPFVLSLVLTGFIWIVTCFMEYLGSRACLVTKIRLCGEFVLWHPGEI